MSRLVRRSYEWAMEVGLPSRSVRGYDHLWDFISIDRRAAKRYDRKLSLLRRTCLT